MEVRDKKPSQLSHAPGNKSICWKQINMVQLIDMHMYVQLFAMFGLLLSFLLLCHWHKASCGYV